MPVRSSEKELSIETLGPVAPISAFAYEPATSGELVTTGRRGVLPRAFVLAGAAFLLVLASNLVSLGFDHLRTTLINANWEYSWSHDVDTTLLGLGVFTSLLGARATRADRRLWSATAAILALFFLDEISALHGQLGNLDKLLYAPILVALVVCVWRLTVGTRDRTLVACSLATLLLAFAMHVVGLHLLRPIGYTNYVGSVRASV